MAELSVTSLQNLEDLLSPLYYGNEEPLPCAPPGTSSVPGGLTVQAFLSQDCMWGCIFNGPVIRCFPVRTHPSPDILVGRGRVPVVINAVAYHFPGSIIKCATELSIHSHRSSSVNKLLLGLDCGNDGGALVIYDPIRAQPMKWISIPAAVTSLTVLSHFGDGNCTHPFFNESMMAMVGVAAVGLYGGKLLIVDLGLDHLEGSLEATKHNYNLHSRDRKWDLTYVEPHEPFIAQKRRAAALTKQLICLDLQNQDYDESDERYDPDLFYYTDKAGTLIGTYNKHEVYVSCLQYVSNIGSLVAGFNFGGLQIWRVDDHQLEFSTDVGIEEAAVHSIEFQQPIDDPKNFCYLWVLHGTKCAELQHSHAVLYALFFKNRSPSENNSVLYESLESCVGRLTINLQDFYCSEEEGIDLSLNSSRFLVRPLRMWNQGENLTCFSWESYRDGLYYIGIFDLNQWYSSQTPSKLECFGQFRLNPFWASISFRNPIDIRRNVCSQMWDVRVIPRTMGRWENQFSKHDVHLYPASLTFQAVCLGASGTYIFENFCIQEKLLRLIQKDGYQMMSDAGVLRKLCGEFGLDPMCSLISDGKMSDQYYVFTVLLENNRSSLIINMANRWVNGSMANLGCNIDLILKWISHLTIAIRLLADEHWLNLVRFRRDLLPPDSTQFVIYSNFVWNQLSGVLGTLVRHDRVMEDMERDDDIGKLRYTLSKLIPYSSALLMMHKARILPVTDDYDVITPLKAICDQRRTEVSYALENCPHLEPELRQGHTLLIDFLLENFDEDFIREEWDLKPGEDIYPPKHPAFIFNMLIGNWIDIDPKIIARVIFYFILDVMNLIGHETTLRGDFASLIQLTDAEQQEVVNLWRIDHGEFQDPLTFLSQGGKIDETEGLPWSAAIVLMIAQGATTPVIDILQRSCPPKLGRLFINLVSDSHQHPEDKLMQIVSSSSFCRDVKLLLHCFDRAYTSGFLENFIDIHSRHTPLFVQQALISYLENSSFSYEHQQLLLTYFLRRKDNLRAIEQHEKIKKSLFNVRTLSPENKRIWEAREIEINHILTQSSKNHIMEFLGYSAKKSIQRPPPLDVKANKCIPKSPLPNIGSRVKAIPAFKRLLEWEKHMRDGATPISPLRRYSGKIDKPTTPEKEIDPNETIGEYENAEGGMSPNVSPDRINVDLILKSPRVDYRKLQEFEDDEGQTIFQTPCGTPGASGGEFDLHSIMIKSKASLRKRIALKTRFKDIPDSDDDIEVKPLRPLDLDQTSISIDSDNGEPELGDMELGFDTAVESNEEMVEIDDFPPPRSTEVDNSEPENDIEVRPSSVASDIDMRTSSVEETSEIKETPWTSERDVDSIDTSSEPQSTQFDNPEPEIDIDVRPSSVASETHTSSREESSEITETPLIEKDGNSPAKPLEALSTGIDNSEPENGIKGPPFTVASDIRTSLVQEQSEIKETLSISEEDVDSSVTSPVPRSTGLDDSKESENDIEVRPFSVASDTHIYSTDEKSEIKETPWMSERDVDSIAKPPDSLSTGFDNPEPEIDTEVEPFIVASDTGPSPTEEKTEIKKTPWMSERDVDSIAKLPVSKSAGFESLEPEYDIEVRPSSVASDTYISSREEISEIRETPWMSESDIDSIAKLRDARSTSESDNESVVSQSQVARKKVLKMIKARRRGATPESDTSQMSGGTTSPVAVRRMTRSASRAMSEDTSRLDTSMNRSDSDVSILDATLDIRGSKRRTRKKSVPSIAEIIATKDAAREKSNQKRKARSEPRDIHKASSDFGDTAFIADKRTRRTFDTGFASEPSTVTEDSKKSLPSIAEIVASKDVAKGKSPRKRKARSEPREIHKEGSDIGDTSFISDKPVRRAIFGFAPGLSTVIEDSETSLLQTPSRNTRSKSLTNSQSRLPKTPSALGKIPEELSENKPGPSRRSKPVETTPSPSQEAETKPGKRRRRAISEQPKYSTSTEEPVKAKRLKEKDATVGEKEGGNSDVISDISSSRRRGPSRPRTRSRSSTNL